MIDFKAGDVITDTPVSFGRHAIVIVVGRDSEHYKGYLFGNHEADVWGYVEDVDSRVGVARRAVVSGDDTSYENLNRVQRYLPSNYRVEVVRGQLVIEGWDNAGWTLDGYVIPRLESGLIRATEVTA